MKSLTAYIRRPQLLSILLAGLFASALVTGSTLYALGAFTATVVNNGDNAASGTIILSEGQGSTTCFSTTADAIIGNSANCATIDLFGGGTNIVPGTSNSLNLTFENVGTADASSFTARNGNCSGVANPATAPYYGTDTSAGFCGEIDVTIENDTGTPTCLYPAQAGACPTPSSSYTLATLTAASPLSLGSLAAGASDTLKFTTELDSSAGNSDQGMSASEDVTWLLSQ